jgi:hypothetical protein
MMTESGTTVAFCMADFSVDVQWLILDFEANIRVIASPIFVVRAPSILPLFNNLLLGLFLSLEL